MKKQRGKKNAKNRAAVAALFAYDLGFPCRERRETADAPLPDLGEIGTELGQFLIGRHIVVHLAIVELLIGHKVKIARFALYMEVERKRLGLEGSGAASILNVKTGPLLQGSYLGMQGILPAYHMNKTNWVSIILDAIDQKTFEELLDISWELTK